MSRRDGGELVWMVRHADAGDRLRWTAPDAQRPLSPKGRRQAQALVAVLAANGAHRATRVLSSPYVRCVETVEPVAAALGFPVEPEDALAEGGDVDGTLGLIARNPGAVMCSHGDVIADLVLWLDGRDLLGGGEPEWRKASTWVLRTVNGKLAGATYLAPPVIRV